MANKKVTVAELTDPAFTPEPVKVTPEKESEGTAYTEDVDMPMPTAEDAAAWREKIEAAAKRHDRKQLARQFAATIFSFKGFTVNEKTLPEQAYKYADAFLAYEAEIGA